MGKSKAYRPGTRGYVRKLPYTRHHASPPVYRASSTYPHTKLEESDFPSSSTSTKPKRDVPSACVCESEEMIQNCRDFDPDYQPPECPIHLADGQTRIEVKVEEADPDTTDDIGMLGDVGSDEKRNFDEHLTGSSSNRSFVPAQFVEKDMDAPAIASMIDKTIRRFERFSISDRFIEMEEWEKARIESRKDRKVASLQRRLANVFLNSL